jgi:DNA-binding transcriptional regulator YdaS (Cro superfamily)
LFFAIPSGKVLFMNLKDWTQQVRGRQASLASQLGVPATNVCQWVSGLKTPSIKTAVAIEVVTSGEVTRKDLRPADWQLIWPELANQPTNDQAA